MLGKSLESEPTRSDALAALKLRQSAASRYWI